MSAIQPFLWTRTLFVVWSVGLAWAAGESVEVSADGGTNASPPILECGVYMAPSTLGEATNMGIYTGKDLKPNEVINFPEIAIPIMFREWGSHKEGISGMFSLLQNLLIEGLFLLACASLFISRWGNLGSIHLGRLHDGFGELHGHRSR
jgi:hypothetical protein